MENTKSSEALRSSIISSTIRSLPIKKCMHCKETLRKVKYSFKKLMVAVTHVDMDASL